MRKINYTVMAEAGIHARPAGLLVKQAALTSALIFANTSS